MSSFKQKLSKSGQNVLDERARILFQRAKLKEDAYIQSKKEAVLEIQAQIAQHGDLAIRSTTSLTPGGKDFDAGAWVEKRHDLEQQLRCAKIQYALAVKVDNAEFPKADDEDANIDIKGIDLTE